MNCQAQVQVLNRKSKTKVQSSEERDQDWEEFHNLVRLTVEYFSIALTTMITNIPSESEAAAEFPRRNSLFENVQSGSPQCQCDDVCPGVNTDNTDRGNILHFMDFEQTNTNSCNNKENKVDGTITNSQSTNCFVIKFIKKHCFGWPVSSTQSSVLSRTVSRPVPGKGLWSEAH